MICGGGAPVANGDAGSGMRCSAVLSNAIGAESKNTTTYRPKTSTSPPIAAQQAIAQLCPRIAREISKQRPALASMTNSNVRNENFGISMALIVADEGAIASQSRAKRETLPLLFVMGREFFALVNDFPKTI